MKDATNWMDSVVEGYKNLLNDGLEIFGNKEKAIAYANENSCAGKEAKRLALINF